MATTTQSSIIAVFRKFSDAQAAIKDLQAAGIPSNDIYLETGSGDLSGPGTKKREGGIVGWFKSIFGDESESDRSYYEDALTKGMSLVRVDTAEDQIDTVEQILNRHAPENVVSDEDVAPSTSARATGEAPAKKTGNAIPVVKEEVQIGKQRVLRGGIRVYSRVVREPVEQNVSLQEERVRVERQRVDRPATAADLSAGEEQVVEVQEFAEEPVVSKQARVVEEVRVGKEASQRTETVRDSVRRTEVNVEQIPAQAGATTAQTFDDSDFRADFQRRYGTSGATYDTYLPAYRYGYEVASDPRYRGKSWDQIESDLRSDYGRRYPNSTWERMKDAVRYGWDKVTGKTKAART